MEHLKKIDLNWVFELYGNDTQIMHYASNRDIYNAVLKLVMKNIYLKNTSWVEIDWDRYEQKYFFRCDIMGYDNYVKRMLQKSVLSKHKFLIFDTGSSPILKININYFFDNWWKVLTSNGQGVYAFTEDGDCIIECRNHSIIYSNFLVFDEEIDNEFLMKR